VAARLRSKTMLVMFCCDRCVRQKTLRTRPSRHPRDDETARDSSRAVADASRRSVVPLMFFRCWTRSLPCYAARRKLTCCS